MGWPMSQDFNEAMQNPRISLDDPDLKTGETVVGSHGMPLSRSGNFADVYQLGGAESNYNGVAWPAEFQKSFDQHIREGKIGFVLFHAVNNCFGGWAELNQMIGMGWRASPLRTRGEAVSCWMQPKASE